LKKSGFSNVFEIGDTLIVTAEGRADAYALEIYRDSSVVFVENGEFHASEVEIYVPLSPSAFSAGATYVVSLEVYSYNDPIPGAYFMDSAASAFGVVSVATRLGLIAEYDGLTRSLCLRANLTDVNNFPVANETVDFLLQFADKRRLTEGWLPLGSALTDANGRQN
jgi:hypothetical protein